MTAFALKTLRGSEATDLEYMFILAYMGIDTLI